MRIQQVKLSWPRIQSMVQKPKLRESLSECTNTYTKWQVVLWSILFWGGIGSVGTKTLRSDGIQLEKLWLRGQKIVAPPNKPQLLSDQPGLIARPVPFPSLSHPWQGWEREGKGTGRARTYRPARARAREHIVP